MLHVWENLILALLKFVVMHWQSERYIAFQNHVKLSRPNMTLFLSKWKALPVVLGCQSMVITVSSVGEICWAFLPRTPAVICSVVEINFGRLNIAPRLTELGCAAGTLFVGSILNRRRSADICLVMKIKQSASGDNLWNRDAVLSRDHQRYTGIDAVSIYFWRVLEFLVDYSLIVSAQFILLSHKISFTRSCNIKSKLNLSNTGWAWVNLVSVTRVFSYVDFLIYFIDFYYI